MVLPIVERELRVAARRRSTYRLRIAVTLAMIVGFVFAEMQFLTRNTSAAEQSQFLFEIFAWLAFLFAMLGGVLGTADCVSVEKRDGTLGLLFLTDLRGYDVIFGKLAAKSVSVFYGLMASLPILSLPILIGGVAPWQFIQATLLLLTVLPLSCAVGILVSTYSTNERKALVFAVLALSAIMFLPLLAAAALEGKKWIDDLGALRIANFSPFFSMGYVIFATRMGGMMPAGMAKFLVYHTWITLGWMWLLTAIFLLRAARKAPHSWQIGDRIRTPLASRLQLRIGEWKPPRALLDFNPYQWLAMRGETTPKNVWGFVLAIFGIWAIGALQYGRFMLEADVLGPTVGIVNVFLKVWIVAEASRRFIEDRQNNALELLLSTPLTGNDMVKGQWAALVKQFSIPVIVTAVWELVVLWNAHAYRGEPPSISSAFFLVLDSVALGWLAMFFAAKFKGRMLVMLGSLCLVLVVPLLVDLVTQYLASFSSRRYFAANPNGQYPDIQEDCMKAGTFLFDLLVAAFARNRLFRNFGEMAKARQATAV
jgi:ABC-type transport system involved in cytochrome c biogenesis permease component